MPSSQTFVVSGPGDPGSNLASLALLAEQRGVAFIRLAQPDLLIRLLWKNACWLVLVQGDNNFHVLAEGHVDEVTRGASAAAAGALAVLGLEVQQGGFDISDSVFMCPIALPEFPAADTVVALLSNPACMQWLRGVHERLSA